MFTFGGEKGVKKVNVEDNEKLYKEVCDMARCVVEFMDAKELTISQKISPRSTLVSHPTTNTNKSQMKSAPISVKGVGRTISFDPPQNVISNKENLNIISEISASLSQESILASGSKNRNSGKNLDEESFFLNSWMMILFNTNMAISGQSTSDSGNALILRKVTEALIDLITLYSVELNEENLCSAEGPALENILLIHERF